MALRERLADAARSLLGVTVYENATPTTGIEIDDETIDRLRRQLGGNLQPPAIGRYRWHVADLEKATEFAERGDLERVGQLWRAMKRDGLIRGLTSTRTAGLVALPRRFRGDPQIIADLTDENDSRSVFDEMFPPSELAQMAADGVGIGVGVGELVPVVGRDHPVLVRQDPRFLRYRWNEGRWYFTSIAGQLPIVPGDGRWILHTPGGRIAPWESGDWQSLGRAFIDKEHALLHRGNFGGKLANPARVAYAPNGSTEAQRLGFLSKLIRWGINSVFELPPGWEAKLLESNGRGWEVFGKQIEDANLEIMIAIAGQVVTVTGGTGFANADIHQMIRADLIKQTGDALAYTLNTQGIPPWIFKRYGEKALARSVRVGWDTRPPVDRKDESEAMSGAAKALTELDAALASVDMRLAVDDLVARFGIPVDEGKPPRAYAEPSDEGGEEEKDDAAE